MDRMRDSILNLIKNAKSPISSKEITDMCPHTPKVTVYAAIKNLYASGRLERVGKGNRGYLYIISGEKIELPSGYIDAEEIKKAKIKAVPGMIVRYVDENGEERRSKILKQYPYHCMMEDGHSFTWGQMAVYLRNRKWSIR